MISLRWIREFVDLPTEDPTEISEALSSLGMEVEGVHHVELAFSGVVVARVLGVRPHPGADRLRLVQVDTGTGEQEVVCGAWNFEAGAVVPLATVGARLVGGLEVGERRIRGVVSRGMLCSETELGLSEEGGGILILGDEFSVGADFASALAYPDVLFDAAITPNRPDLMSIYGIARDLAAYFEVPVRSPVVEVAETEPPTKARGLIEDRSRCPRLTAREVRGLRIGPSPLWLRLRLRDAGVRAISNVVDITNYVMLELGQPIHAFDLDLIPSQTLVIRRAGAGENLTTLDGIDRSLVPEDLVVASPEGPLALAGVMGGASSEIHSGTTRVLIEAAHFAAPGVLLSGKRHGLRSEAGARFERGVDPALPPLASARAARMMGDLAGGEVAGGFIDVYPVPILPWTVDLPREEPARLLGAELGAGRIANLLTRLGFGVVGEGPWRVTVPTFRPDVTRPADLVEEIARLHGYDKFPSRLPKGVGDGLPAFEQRRRLVRSVLIGAGLHEILVSSFQGPEEISALRLDRGDPRFDMVAVRNPLNEEQGFLRSSLIPGLLQALRSNLGRGAGDVAVFTMGRVFFSSAAELPSQPQRVAFASVGRAPGLPRWEGVGRDRDARDAVGLWETLAGALGLQTVVEQAEEAPFHPGRCGKVSADGVALGHVGELHPAVAAGYGLVGRVVIGDLTLEPLLAPRPHRQFAAPSAYPPIIFDLAFELAAEVPAADLTAVVVGAAGTELESLELFDLYVGPPLDEGRKSIAVRLTFRHASRTLTDADVVPVRRNITRAVETGLGGRLRGA
jgi:phenylalanyl-tRNA synthetase beta chain